MGNWLRSILFYLWVAISASLFYIVAAIIMLMTVVFDRRLAFLHLATSAWASSYLWIMPAWSVSVEGRHHFRKDATYVIVSNHLSMLDILIGFRLFFPFKWVAKAELFKIPIIGWGMSLNRYIKLKRGNLKSVRQMVNDCEKAVSQGSSVYLFPEGTRSETGVVKRFKPGAFALAKKMQVPILPVVITGTKDALPKKSLMIQGKHHINVKVLEEIPYATFADTPVEELAQQVRQRIVAEVGPAETMVL